MTLPQTLVCLDTDVRFTASETSGRTAYIAHHQATGKFFQFGSEEYRIAMLLDGARDVAEIRETLLKEGVDWDGEDVAKFIAQLVKSNLAVVKCRTAAATSASGQASGTPSNPRRFGILRPAMGYLPWVISQRIPLFHGDAFADWLDRRIGKLFDRVGIGLWCVLVSSGLFVVYGHWREFAAEIRRLFDPELWPLMIVILILAKVIHESGHAASAKHYGVKVGGIGIMFFFFAPLAYVDVTDAWRLKSRWARIQIALGGVYLELAIAAIAAWTWWLLPSAGYTRHLAAQIFLILGPATLLVNANPLLRLDGYYVASDLAGIPNLRMHGRRDLGAFLEWLFFAVPQRRSLLSGWQYWFAILHGIASVIFQFFWMGGLIVGVAMWDKAIGMLLAIAALLIWFVLPSIRWIARIWMLAPGDRFFMNRYRHRLLLYLTIIIAVFPYISVCRSPLERRVAIVVRFQNEQIARSPSNAFVQSVFVQHGQFVERGKLLVQLSNPELVLRRDKKADDLELAKMQSIQARRQGDLSHAAAFAENAQSLARQLRELDSEVSQLSIFASRDGYVLASEIEQLSAAFVKQGQEILRVSDPREKELLALVAETDIDTYQWTAVANRSADVRLRGGKLILARPGPLRPRALQTLPHPALAATTGGPLAVELSTNESNRLRLVKAHFESVTKLDPITSSEVRAGQLGTMTLADTRPLLSRILASVLSQKTK